jgi:tRNA threonylcarbamoyladenosine biosynthesis protein TsaB
METVKISLGIDCCFNWTSVGLSRDGTVLSEIQLNEGRKQSRNLPIAVDSLLGFSGLTLDEIGQVVLNTGPGSFTGLRLGLSYGLSLAAALGCPVVPFNSLELRALDFKGFADVNLLAPVIWAKHGFLYGAVYLITDDVKNLSPLHMPSFFTETEFLQTLSSLDERPLLILPKDRSYPLLGDFPFAYSADIPSGGRLSTLGYLFPERETSFSDVSGTYLRPPDIG